MSAGELVVKFTVPGEPVPKERPRHSDGVTYTPRKTKDAEEAVQWAVTFAAPGLKVASKETEFFVSLEFHVARKNHADVDNLSKLVLDACNRLVWHDDRQVTTLFATIRRGSANPRTEAVIMEANPQ